MVPAPPFSRMATNGVQLNVASLGPEEGPLLILLHGFPEFWYAWRHQLGPFSEAGYRVIAPDQRGYNRSDKPPHVASYCLDLLADDVAGLIEATGRQTASVVGHDWGGVVAWWTALRHPTLVDRLVVLNAPHPTTFKRTLRRHPSQIVKSWYVFFFQLPRLPERRLGRHNFEPLVQALRTTSRPGTFSDGDFDHYRDAWSQPTALTTMIHWYRAAMRNPPRPMTDTRVRQPVLLIWGVRDRFLNAGLAPDSIKFCDRGHLHLIEQATHWVQHEEPDRVNQLLLDFLAET